MESTLPSTSVESNICLLIWKFVLFLSYLRKVWLRTQNWPINVKIVTNLLWTDIPLFFILICKTTISDLNFPIPQSRQQLSLHTSYYSSVMSEQNPLEAILKTCESIVKCAESHLSNLFNHRLYQQQQEKKKKNRQTELTTEPTEARVFSAQSRENPPPSDANVQMLSIQAISPTVTDAKVNFNSICFVCSIVFMRKSYKLGYLDPPPLFSVSTGKSFGGALDQGIGGEGNMDFSPCCCSSGVCVNSPENIFFCCFPNPFIIVHFFSFQTSPPSNNEGMSRNWWVISLKNVLLDHSTFWVLICWCRWP